MPRVLTAAAVGAGLALCGAVMQALTRNPLADPYLLGLSSGASVGAVVVMVLGVGLLLPVAAFAGALVALVATLGAGEAPPAASPRRRTVLAGLAVRRCSARSRASSSSGAPTGDSYREILSWLLGSLAGADWARCAIAGGALVVVGVPLARERPHAGRVRVRRHRGGRARRRRRPQPRVLLLVGTALLTGALVAVSGAIGFVGLVLPHAVRLLVGSRHRALLPLSALAGAIFLVWADTPPAPCSTRGSCRSASSPRSSACRCSPCSCCATEAGMTGARRSGARTPHRVRFAPRRRLILDGVDARCPPAPSAGCSARTAPASRPCCG